MARQEYLLLAHILLAPRAEHRVRRLESHRGAVLSVHVAFVSQNIYPHDYETRLTKAARSLVQAGERVTVFSKGTGDATLEGVRIKRFDASTLPINPRWILWLTRMFRQEGIDVAIARDLRLAPATILAARRAGIPVIFDTGENHPAHVAALGKQHLSHYIIRNATLVGALERWCVRQADEVWVVAEANRQRLARFMRNGRKIRLIRNVPELDMVGAGLTPGRRPGVSGLRLVYLGILDAIRGLDMLLQAVAKTGDVDLVLVGDGSERRGLEQIARDLGISDRVTFCGWISGPAKLDELQRADVGVISHKVNYLTQTTEPNKLFDYMLCGLPVLSTPLDPVIDVINAERCGRIAEYAANAWALAITELARDPAGRAAMGERGRQAVLERYNWQREAEQVVAAVRELGELA